MPKIDAAGAEPQVGGDYPAPFDCAVAERRVRTLSAAAGLTDLVVNHVTLPEGAWSSQRHWHEGEDELLVMLAGAATLIDDAGETSLAPGDCAAFPKNDGNGHHLRGGHGGCTFVVFSVPAHSDCHYPDIDLVADHARGGYRHRDGTPY